MSDLRPVLRTAIIPERLDHAIEDASAEVFLVPERRRGLEHKLAPDAPRRCLEDVGDELFGRVFEPFLCYGEAGVVCLGGVVRRWRHADFGGSGLVVGFEGLVLFGEVI